MNKDHDKTVRIKAMQQQALEEKAARDQAQIKAKELAKEVGGRDGPEPTRFGDWEKKGLISDF